MAEISPSSRSLAAFLLTLSQHKTHSPLCVPGVSDNIQNMVERMNMGRGDINMNLPGLGGIQVDGLTGPGNLPLIGEDDAMRS